jgi:hypothetical protein
MIARIPYFPDIGLFGRQAELTGYQALQESAFSVITNSLTKLAFGQRLKTAQHKVIVFVFLQ